MANWYLRGAGGKSGPFTDEQMREMRAARMVSMLDEVSLDGVTWVRLGMTLLAREPAAASPLRPAPVSPAAPAGSRAADSSVAASAETAAQPRGRSAFADSLLSLPPFRKIEAFPAGLNGGPRKFAVLAGVNEYDAGGWLRFGYSPSPLRGCLVDLRNVYTLLRREGGWEGADMAVFSDGNATVRHVRDAVHAAADVARPGDTFVFYESSHGARNADESFLCLHDGPYLKSDFASDLTRFPEGVTVVVLLDTCHSGGMARGTRAVFDFVADVTASFGKRGLFSRGKRGFLAPDAVGWITAASATEFSLERYDSATHGGEFTFAFCDGIRDGTSNNAKYGDCSGITSFYEAWNYAKDIATGAGNSVSTPQCVNPKVCARVRIPVPQ